MAERLDVKPGRGLDDDEVAARLEEYGRNELREHETRSVADILAEQFKSLLIALLVVAAVISYAVGEDIESLAIVAVIAINAAIGFVTEWRAVRSMEALREIGGVESRVRRGGEVTKVDAEELVPGDVLVLSEGDVVPADSRLVEVANLQADEAALTGESLPVDKDTGPLAEDTPLAERANMVYKGTVVVHGSGEAVVVGTGMDSELGHISILVEQAEESRTPLERRLDALGRRLVVVTLGVAALVAVSGGLAGRDWVRMVETGIALAVATVPEGLPVVATLALARGMMRMAERNALINRLSAVETLGATTVICTDKTGTLTEGQMQVDRIVTGQGTASPPFDAVGSKEFSGPVAAVLEAAALCGNATQDEGDPLEVALVRAAAGAGVQRNQRLEALPEVREVAFDRATKMMATIHRTDDDGLLVFVKGAPEAVLDASDAEAGADGNDTSLGDDARERWREANEDLAADGLRVIAVARKGVDATDADATDPSAVEPYGGLLFLGLVGLLDPPREDVREAIDACHAAGIRVVMVTGDQAATARYVARSIGLAEDPQALSGKDFDTADEATLRAADVLARVSPEQKLRLIDAYQQGGDVVAMTGDGVNDAPALKKADIGIAMGLRGTAVAQQASAMVLRDDAFGTIVTAVEQGRVIFGNIRRFVLYLLSCNLSEVLVVGIAVTLNAPLPLLPLQILFLNLVTDVFPALALGLGEANPQAMQEPPRSPQEPILTRRHWASIALFGGLLTVAVLAAFAYALFGMQVDRTSAVTVSFLTLAVAQLWHVFDMRELGTHPLRNEVTTNPWVWGAVALSVGLLYVAVAYPPVATLLELTWPSPQEWGVVAVASIAPILIIQVILNLPGARRWLAIA